MLPIRNLRWWIGALLFASTVINYIDRQTLSLLSPYLKQLYHWTNSDYANLLIGFRIAYSIGQSVCGRLMDRVGTRRGLTLSVLWYSIVSWPLHWPAGSTVSRRSDFFWALASPPTGRARRRLFRSGSRSVSVLSPQRCSTAAHRLEERLHPLSYSQSTTIGAGVRRLQFPECWVSFGCSSGVARTTCPRIIHASATKSGK